MSHLLESEIDLPSVNCFPFNLVIVVTENVASEKVVGKKTLRESDKKRS